MNIDKKWTVLFIKDDESMFDAETKVFDTLFNKVDKVLGRAGALKLFQSNTTILLLVISVLNLKKLHL